MSHNYFSAVVPITATESQIKRAVVNNCYGYNGEAECMMSDIAARMGVRIIGGCRTEKEAEELLDSNDDFYWGGYIKAVPFCKASDNKKTLDLYRRIGETEQKEKDYLASHRVADQKAAFIGCPECKSKIAKVYFENQKQSYLYKVDRCPVCNASMASETVKKTLQGYRDKIEALNKELEAERKRISEKPTHYLAMCGIHD